MKKTNINLKELCVKLYNIAFQNKTIGIDVNLLGAKASIEFKFFNYNYDRRKKVIELISDEDDTVFTIDTTKILKCVKYEEIEGYRYNIQFDSWSADVNVMYG